MALVVLESALLHDARWRRHNFRKPDKESSPRACPLRLGTIFFVLLPAANDICSLARWRLLFLASPAYARVHPLLKLLATQREPAGESPGAQLAAQLPHSPPFFSLPSAPRRLIAAAFPSGAK
jgi:hypothetical protein